MKILTKILMGCKTILLEKTLGAVIDQRLKERGHGNCESLDRYENHLETPGWGTKLFCRKMVGVRKLFLCSRWDKKFSLIVRNYPLPGYPGLKMIIYARAMCNLN